MDYVRENAIICRSVIDTEAFGSVIQLSDFIKICSHNSIFRY